MPCLSAIKQYALSLGFDACGAARCRAVPEAARVISRWTAEGLHAGMGYMERNCGVREDPARLFEGARTVLVCLMSYKTDIGYRNDEPRIAAYARGIDYHYILKSKLTALGEYLQEISPDTRSWPYVDSAPIPEKTWAVEAGLGWIGRNSLLIHPVLGSMCFIGILLTTLEPDSYDKPYAEDHCGTCRRCIDACPSRAIRTDKLIDARQCFSYQTIENRGPIPETLLPLLGDRLYGCDTCLQACPYNQKAPAVNHPEFTPLPVLLDMDAACWLAMGRGEFKSRFQHSPMFRTGLKKLKLTLTQKAGYDKSILSDVQEF